MNPQNDGTSRPLQWWRLPWILNTYIAFAVLALAWGHFGISLFPRLYEKTVPFTGWSGLGFYSFSLVLMVMAILTPRRSSGRNAVVGLLVFGAVFGLWDTYEHTWGSGAGRDDQGNPFLIYSPWQPLITVGVPLIWAFMLISPPMNRWVKSTDRFHTPYMALFRQLMAPFVPSRMVVVEGSHEQLFLESLLRIRFPRQKFSVASVTPVRSYHEIEKELIEARDYFGDLRNAPFQSLMFFVFDLQSSERRNRFVELGMSEDQIEVLSKKGIEHYYPRSIMKDIFQCGDADLERLSTDSDEIEINGIRKAKDDLCKLVCDQVTSETVLDEELSNLLAMISETSE